MQRFQQKALLKGSFGEVAEPYEEFFRERQDARYGGKGGARCCYLRKTRQIIDASTIPAQAINSQPMLADKIVIICFHRNILRL